MKAILVVIGGIALLSETFTLVQWAGFVTVLGGVYWYSTGVRQSFWIALFVSFF